MIELLLEAERALAAGKVDRAEQLYRQVADADAHSAIAVVGLARVAEGRGDVLGGYMLARRALSIDPEDDVARRLVARLEDDLAARGGATADPTRGAAPAGATMSSPAAAPVASAAVPPTATSPAPAGPEQTTSPQPPPPRRRSILARLLGRGR